jgi:O-antigen/teichoic acid export membrane protein
VDSVLAVRLLSAYSTDAVALYGLFSGGAVTVINLPVSVCYGLAAASIPAVAGKKGNPRKRIRYALFVTVAVALPCALALYLFAEPATRVIFRSLHIEERATLVRLVKALAISALTLSCVQTLSACLTAQGKPKYAALGMFTGVAVKTAAYSVWLKNPKISVFGLAYAGNRCYLVAFLILFLYNLLVTKGKKRKKSKERCGT